MNRAAAKKSSGLLAAMARIEEREERLSRTKSAWRSAASTLLSSSVNSRPRRFGISRHIGFFKRID